MRESPPSLERLTPRRGRGLPPVAAATAVIATLTFLIGFGLAGRLMSQTGPGTSPSPAAPLTGAAIGRELTAAYLGVEDQRWAVCSIRATTPCRPTNAASSRQLADFRAMPLTVTARDWAQLRSITLPPGHYVLAGPMALVAPRMVVARISTSGTGTILKLNAETVANGVIWADLGTLKPGRYVAVVEAYDLQAVSADGEINAEPFGWALGLAIGPSQ